MREHVYVCVCCVCVVQFHFFPLREILFSFQNVPFFPLKESLSSLPQLKYIYKKGRSKEMLDTYFEIFHEECNFLFTVSEL